MASALPGLIGTTAPHDGVACMHALGRDNVAALAIGILQKSDVGGSVGVVLQTLDYGRDTVLAALPIDNSIVLFMTTPAMPCGNTPGVVTTAGFFCGLIRALCGAPLCSSESTTLTTKRALRRLVLLYNCHA